MYTDIDIHKEILAGCVNEKDRIDGALENAAFYKARFPRDDALQRRSSTDWSGDKLRRDSRIMNWLVGTLAADLYAHGPARTMVDQPEATDWLNAIYKASATDALLQSADCWACVSQAVAVQAIATKDPARPVRHLLWPAHQFYQWDSLDEPLTAQAVAVIDRWDQTTRIRLWTLDSVRTYVTKKLMPLQTAGGTAFTLVKQEDNPFGMIPFAFVHFDYPTTEFWSGSPGDAFRELNDYINFALTDVGDSLRFCAKPIVKLRRTRPGWRPNTPIMPADIWNLPGDGEADGPGSDPDAEYLQCDLGFVDAHWSDIQSYLDHSMQCADVPPAAFRLTQDAAASGLSIVAERMPLVQRAERRQRPAGYYERDLARVTCAVGAKHLGNNARLLDHEAMRVSASALEAAASNPDLSLRWPSMKPKLTGQEANTEDAFRLENRLKSRTQILIERDDMTRDEAEAYLDQTAKDLEREEKLLGEPDPIDPPPASGAKKTVADGSSDGDEYDQTDTDTYDE